MEKIIKIKITEWEYEDTITEDMMYSALFPLSKVDGVRIFPKKIEIIERIEGCQCPEPIPLHQKQDECGICGRKIIPKID